MTTVLVVYAAFRHPMRTSLADHLHSFRRYSSNRFIYVNAAVPGAGVVLRMIRADLVILHTLVVDARFNRGAMRRIEKRLEPLRRRMVPKVILPQDEYFDSDYLCDFIGEFAVSHVFSVAPERDWPKIYRSLQPPPHLTRVLTGYLEGVTVEGVNRLGSAATTPVDIVYRAWHAEPWLGRHGRLKVEIGERVRERAPAHGLTTDIKTHALGEYLLGDDWWHFLLSGRWTLGVEGGASILDHDGSLMTATRAYVKAHPGATFEEIEAAVFPGRDGELDLRALSPRHLEACLTRTGQILIEGEYNGILRPWDHYLPLRPDFSNLDEILDLAKDENLRLAMVERAYRDIVESGVAAYPAFVETVLGGVLPSPPDVSADASLTRRLQLLLSGFDAASWLWVRGRTAVRKFLVLPARRVRSAVRARSVPSPAGVR